MNERSYRRVKIWQGRHKDKTFKSAACTGEIDMEDLMLNIVTGSNCEVLKKIEKREAVIEDVLGVPSFK